MFKSLAQVKRELNVGSKVMIKNYMKEKFEKREVSKVNTTSITTHSPTAKSYRGNMGVDIQLLWQKASETRIIGSRIQFLANEKNCDVPTLEHLKKQGKDYWLELEVIDLAN